jgi:hypothetical protein
MELRDEDRNWGLGTYLKNIDNLLSIGFQMPLTLYRHSGMILVRLRQPAYDKSTAGRGASAFVNRLRRDKPES